MVKCDVCGEPATINWEKLWVKWSLDKKGKSSDNPVEYGNCTDHQNYCDKCEADELEEERLRWDDIKKNIDIAIKNAKKL